MRYYLHIPLPEKLRNMIWALEMEFGVQNRSEPHITVVPPREIVNGRSERELVDTIIGRASGNLDACMIIEKGVGYFNNAEGKKETIFIGLMRTPNLLALHDGLVKSVDGILKPAEGNFVDMPIPHITLITKLSPERTEEAWNILNGAKFFHWFFCDEVTLLCKGEGVKRWEKVARFRL